MSYSILFAAVLVLCFLATVLISRKHIPIQKSRKMGQKILDIGPRWHKGKEGTPTMGGIAFIVPAAVTGILACVVIGVKDGRMFQTLDSRYPTNMSGEKIAAIIREKLGEVAEVTVDRDAFVANIKTFVETNIDKIIMYMLGTTNSYGLDALAKIAGYKDYADMRAQVLAQVTANLETVNTSGLESAGTFTLNDNTVTLKSATDTMPGTIDNYGNITVTSPVNDADAKKLLGADTVTMEFKKV